MQTIYQYDSNNIYTGISDKIADDAGCPLGWTLSAPPQIPAGKYVYYLPPDWIIIDEYPVQFAAQTSPNATPGEAPAVI